MDKPTGNWFGGQRSNSQGPLYSLPANWTADEEELWLLQDVASQYHDTYPTGDLVGAPHFTTPLNNNNDSTQLPFDEQSHGRNQDSCLISHTDRAGDALRSPFHPKTPQNEESDMYNVSWLDLGIPEAREPFRFIPPRVDETCHGCQRELPQLRQEVKELRSELNKSLPKIADSISTLYRWVESSAARDRRSSTRIVMMSEARSNEEIWGQPWDNAGGRGTQDQEQQDERSPSDL